MAYIRREAEEVLGAMLAQFKSVLVTGARQVGKTTMLKELLGKDYGYVSLDATRIRRQAMDDPELFFRDRKPPLVIDEIQKAPILFEEAKALLDETDERGSIVFTGSQTLHLMEGASESLAGRVGVLHLPALSLREMLGTVGRGAYVPGGDIAEALLPDGFDLWRVIRCGCYPDLYVRDMDPELYYSSYVQTYVERDVRSVLNVRDEEKFIAFLTLCAARTGQLLNLSDMGSEIGVSHNTVQSWTSVLKASGLVCLLRPLSSNASKRMVKSPKLYFMDTGLACYLLGWSTDKALREGAMAGAMFETFAVTEVIKSYLNQGRGVDRLFFYRDAHGNEIDLVIQRQDVLHPVEVKKRANPTSAAIKAFEHLEGVPGMRRGEGAVICQASEPYSLSETDRAVPLWCV